MEIYCNGKRNEIVDYLNPVAKGIVEEVVREAKKKIKHFYRLDIEIKGSQVIVTIHGKSNLKMRFNYSCSVESTVVPIKLPPAKVTLNRIPSINLEEEIMEAVCSYCRDHDLHDPYVGPCVEEKIVDETNGIAVFIIWEVLERRSLKSPSRRERRLREKDNYYKFSLIQVCKGHEPKILFSDQAWSGERACWIENLKRKDNKIVVDHFTTKKPFSMEEKKEFEKLTFEYGC